VPLRKVELPFPRLNNYDTSREADMFLIKASL